MAIKDEISERFLLFATGIIGIGKELNRTFEGRHVYGQLFRSATSAGANYEESHSSESSRDFIHKREVALKELRESHFWLKLIDMSGLVKNTEKLRILLDENDALIKILAKSLSTFKKNISNQKK